MTGFGAAAAPIQPSFLEEKRWVSCWSALTFGGGYFHTSASYQGVTTTVSGIGPAMNLAFGGVVAPKTLAPAPMTVPVASMVPIAVLA